MKHEQIRAELDAILAYLLTDKKKNQSDKRLINNAALTQNTLWQQQHLDGISNRYNNPNWKSAMQEGVKKRQTNKKWHDSMKKRVKPIVTPWGIFSSTREAAEIYNTSSSTKQGHIVISKKLKQEPEKYYHISKEEYTQLTGKEL